MEYKKLHTPSTCSYSMHEDTASMYWKLLDVNSGKVLDLGSGMGGFGKAKPENISLYGVDRDLSISANSHGYEDVVNMDIGSTVLPFDDDSFDAILARDILEHLDSPWEVVDDLFRILKVGGRIIVSVPKPDPKIVWNDYTHRRGFTSGALSSLMENSGFHVEDIFLMSGYTLAARFKISKILPIIGHIPLLRNFFCSYHCISVKR
ncbi:class I SAM-dependent methyltransferase [Gammaproteobacteria bacterium]|jgi:SAM-dependent methyltransferase|nr:class I SAM-dependent methyltransferase [Gammaproteobacteria bacterium]|tara:strand:+ start:20218 stop:20835 length:618 start_codon:yes stop_codon:yes gene_type:complete